MPVDPAFADLMVRTPRWTTWWTAVQRDPNGNSELPYILAGHLARETLERASRRETADVTELVDAVEWALAYSEPRIRKLFVVGYLESLQNLIRAGRGDASAWFSRFGPVGRAYWTLLDDMWSRRISTREFNRQVDQGITNL